MALPLDPRRKALELLTGQAITRPEPPFIPTAAPPLPEPPTPAITPEQEYATLLEEQRGQRFNVDLARAGAMAAEAISGAKAPMGLYDNLEERAEEPVVAYLRRQQAMTKPGATAKPQKSTDPNSPESRRAQLLVKATLGDKFSDEEISQLTEADADNALKYGSMSGQREVQREGQLGLAQRATAAREQQAKQFAESMGYKWADMAQEERLAWARIAEAQAAREATLSAKRDEQVAGATERFGKEVDDIGAPGFYQRYDEAQGILAKHQKDIPGIGRIDGRKPDEALSPDGRQMRFLVGQLLSDYRKGQTGAGMTEGERVEYGQITGLLNSGNDGAIRQGLDLLRRAMDARLKAQAAGFRPEAVETYGKRNPRVGKVVQPPAGAPLKGASGRPMLDDGKVRILLNGKPKRIPRKNLEAVRALAKERGDTLEVSGG